MYVFCNKIKTLGIAQDISERSGPLSDQKGGGGYWSPPSILVSITDRDIKIIKLVVYVQL